MFLLSSPSFATTADDVDQRSCPLPFGSTASIFDNPDASIVSLPALPPEPEPLMGWYESAEVSQVLQSFVKDYLWPTWRRTHSPS